MKDLMIEFEYSAIYRQNLLSTVYVIFTFFLPNKNLSVKWLNSYPNIIEFEKVSNRLKASNYVAICRVWHKIPNQLKLISLILYSMLSRIRMCLSPENRGCRYI